MKKVSCKVQQWIKLHSPPAQPRGSPSTCSLQRWCAGFTLPTFLCIFHTTLQPALMLCRFPWEGGFFHLPHPLSSSSELLKELLMQWNIIRKKGGVEDKRPQILGPSPRHRETSVFFPHSHLPWFTTQYKGKKKQSHCLWTADDWSYDIMKLIMQKMFKYPPRRAVLSKSGNH